MMHKPLDRRTLLAAAWILPVSIRVAHGKPRHMLDLIDAPNNLGLRPPAAGVEPGTWRAPVVLDAAGLSARLSPARRARLPRPRYSAAAQAGTRIRNGHALRDFSLALAAEVERSLRRGAMPIVIGGDCSNLLGCMIALRRSGGRGLVHIDGHSDFTHPGNDDAASRLGAAAGMDLALATGRGEPLLTAWPGVTGPLVEDADAIQVGEREDIAGYPGLADTAIERISVQQLRGSNVAAVAARVLARMQRRALGRAWLHIDLDVLDQAVMPAVDSPGSPGLTYDELASLVRRLIGSGRVAGLDIAIYDPDLDPGRTHAPNIVACIAAMLDGAR
jgi:arginase